MQEMKNMKILVDTNVIMDFLIDRAPYADEAAKIITRIKLS